MGYKRTIHGQGDHSQAAGNFPVGTQQFANSRRPYRVAATFLWAGAMFAAIACAGRAQAMSQGMARVFTEIVTPGSCAPNSDFRIAISVDSNDQDIIAAYGFLVEYDSSVVSFVSAVDGGDGFNGTPHPSTYGVDPSSQVRVYGISASSTLRNGRLVILTFHTINAADTVPPFSITIADDPLYPDGLIGLESLETLSHGYDNSATDPVLCGRLRFHLEQDFSNDTSGFSFFSLVSMSDGRVVPDFVPPGEVSKNTGTSLSIYTPLNNGTGIGGEPPFRFGLWITRVNALSPSSLYRLKMTLSSSNSSSETNPHVLIGFNSRSTTGYGFTQIIAGAGGPAPGPETWSGYLVPAEPGWADATFAVFDPPVGGPYGGTITASNIEIQSIPVSEVLAAATRTTLVNSFDVGTNSNTQWTYFDTPYAGEGVTLPTFVHTPTSGEANELVLFGHTSSTVDKNWGLAAFLSPVGMLDDLQTGKLAIVRARIYSNTPVPSNLPSLWLNVDTSISQAGFILDRDNAGTNGPTAAPKDYYVVFEPKVASGSFGLRIPCDLPGIDGDIRLSELELLQLDLPVDP